MEKIEFKNNKSKLFWFFLGSVAFVIGSLVIFIYAEQFVKPLRPYWMVRSVGLIGFLFFSIGLYYFPKALFDKKPGFAVTDEGIFDNSTYISPGLIKWENIEDISVVKPGEPGIFITEKLICVKVNNYDELMSGMTKLQRMFLKANKNYMGSETIYITPATLKNCTFDQLYNILLGQFRIHTQN